MRLNQLFLAALAIGVLASCSREEIIREVTPEALPSYIKVGISLPETRAQADHYSNGANKDELKIYNYALFIFNQAGTLEASLIQSPANSTTPVPFTPEPYTGALKFTKDGGYKDGREVNPSLDDDGVLKISAGAKTFFVLMNAPKTLLEQQATYLNDGSMTRQFLTSLTLEFNDRLGDIVGSYDSRTYTGDLGLVYFDNDVPSDGDVENRGFMMTTIDDRGNGYYSETLEENEKSTAKTIELTVGRAMAKVSLASELDPLLVGPGTNQPNGSLEVMNYKIVNNPAEMYIMPNVSYGVWSTPYFKHTTVTGTYFESHNSSHPTNYMQVSKQGAKTFTYAIENANLTPKHGNATIALIEGRFTPYANQSGEPERILKSPVDRTPDTYTPNADFYRVWIPEFIHTGTGQKGGSNYDGFYYTNYFDDADLNAYLTNAAAVNGWPTDGSLKLERIKYTAGICYYRLPLYDKESTAAPYSVKRNRYYNIDIVKVSDAGSGGEVGPDTPGPEIPLEPQSYIEAEIEVLPWTLVNQGGEL